MPAKRKKAAAKPEWGKLYETAASQGGYFTLVQAKAAGYSAPLLHHHLSTDRIERAARGIFRLVHFPPSDNEDLIVTWLWSRQQGVFSHETALMLHELSDALPAVKHLTVPEAWASRRIKVPPGVVLHFRNIKPDETTWLGPIPLTTPLRTLVDSARDSVAPDLVAQARRQAVRRGLVAVAKIDNAMRAARAEAP